MARVRWRPWVRALHRDLGYLSVGLTVVYALSGLAVNHIADWDPNHTQFSATHPIPAGLDAAASDDEVTRAVLSQLGLDADGADPYRADTDNLYLTLPDRTVHVDFGSGQILEEGQRDRFLLRVSNWLHLNRGKKAWTYVADAYAGGLLVLAISGLFMIRGSKGLWGRGALLALLGAAVPVGYVVWSGGP